MVIAIGGAITIFWFMVNHSKKLGDWQQPIKFKESILQSYKTKKPKRDFLYK
jgi:hypothetical protein